MDKEQETLEFLKEKIKPSLHPKLDTLSLDRLIRLKNFISSLESEANRNFEITEINADGKNMEISATHSITLME
tara:strand:+ start:586 stop:807 length:222 start_codon:yes stop_codon:yes gene_type:complete